MRGRRERSHNTVWRECGERVGNVLRLCNLSASGADGRKAFAMSANRSVQPGERTIYIDAEPFTYKVCDSTPLALPGYWHGELTLNAKLLITSSYKQLANLDNAMLRLVLVNRKEAAQAEMERYQAPDDQDWVLILQPSER